MNSTKTGQWLRYWRNSLADAESGKGALTSKELRTYLSVPVDSLKNGYLDKDSDVLESLFKNEAENVSLVKVVYRPTAYKLKFEHGKKYTGSFPEIVTPVICIFWVSRNGFFLPESAPVIPRDLLSPQHDDKLTLSSVKEMDNFLDQHELLVFSEQEAIALFKSAQSHEELASYWAQYHHFTRCLFIQLCHDFVLRERYENKKGKGYLLRCDDVSNGTRNILKLFDWLDSNQEPIPLIENYARGYCTTYQPCIDSLASLAARSGHSNSKFPLADAQRDALAQVLTMSEGEILAVNGPPGTGKTTFVLSVVASMWVDAALKEQEPPLIIAASTNNQAVTNIIEAFGKDFEENSDRFSGRWLPDVNSYGGYFPASSLESGAAKYYQTAAFYRSLEDPEYIDRAESAFLTRAQTVFNDSSLDTVLKVKQRLYAELSHHHQQFDAIHHDWQAVKCAEKSCYQAMGDDAELAKATKQSELAALQQALSLIAQDVLQWKQFCADESILLTLLNVVPPIAKKRQLRREIFIEQHFSATTRHIVNVEGDGNPETALSQWIDTQQQAITQTESVLENWNRLLEEKSIAQQRWLSRASIFIAAPEAIQTLDQLDKALDTSLRFKLFQLAVHYWEARWLLDCRAQEDELLKPGPSGKEKTGLKFVRPRWYRRMKITPCIVSTLHSLPGHMKYRIFEADSYLINEIDLLIIDEAGQVSPDTAAASFALAKRALVIGDVHQIKPVSSQSQAVDVGNMMQHRLLSHRDEYPEIRQLGRSVVDGSVMRIAQSASRYRYLDETEPGMFLREHRRCFDEIISFCNDLCYQGLLLPKRGRYDALNDNKLILPAFGYLHIDGMAESPMGGSRINRLEAATIASWLAEKRTELEAAYQSKLEDIVGVITPFKAQERLIAELCEAQGIKMGRGEGEMTVGTVHALQGAERKVVIFSAVYSRHNDGGFIDGDPSMLNVAVSRAKDSFLVFGDMDVISSAGKSTPRHMLGKYLFSREENELSFSIGSRPDLMKLCPKPKLINGSEEHDPFFLNLLSIVQKRVDMVSPWLILSRLVDSGFLKHMQAAAARGIEVNIYTDYYFNAFDNNQYHAEKDQTFKQCCEALRNNGVQVYVMNRVHSKIVMADEQVMCVGSYNWGSAVREGRYKNMETSMLYSGNLKPEIQIQLEALQARVRKAYGVKKVTGAGRTVVEEGVM
ncbi:DNA helicase [Budviciaceae bacterium BWR-B9]|uniref:DNA helicase n=1 Tax=Limnobaculum allomyrinae TaxID=2791986 RepID=A0ABS1IS07_9GAMM|nr:MULTISPECIES: AAA domain-containing protein [Limnobaculum]MBK5144545.1 DNA helicase [Limnobaculum allomyrinae]MBV7692226.1 DNA helicase [Limnobaculum sp. M2-1]